MTENSAIVPIDPPGVPNGRPAARLSLHGLMSASALALSLMLAGCGSGPTLVSGLSGEDTLPPADSAPAETRIVEGPRTRIDATIASPFSLADVAADSGTAVSARIAEMRDELVRLQQDVQGQALGLQDLRLRSQQLAADYYSLIAAISARLQAGSTPGNPRLIAQWEQAQLQLEDLADAVGRLNGLATEIARSASISGYLTEQVRASYRLTGAVEEDHAELAILEDEINRSVVQIDRLLNELNEDINRQSTYVSSERRNLQTLALAVNNGQLYGQSLANRAFFTAPVEAMGTSPSGGMTAAPGQRPLVVIRFDRPNVTYEQAVYQAVSEALDRFPQAMFELVAVSPANGNAAQVALQQTEAKRSAEDVLRTLTQMGLPIDRITVSATSSAAAASPEVQLFLR